MPAPTDLTEALAATYRDALARLSGGCDWTSLATGVTALMPPLYRRVLVTLAEGLPERGATSQRSVDIAYWDGRVWHLARSLSVIDWPLAWMPLPEPVAP